MWAVFFFFILIGCASPTVEDYQEQGEAVQRAIVRDLRKIHQVEELQAAVPRLRSHFNHLVDVVIEAREHFDAENIASSHGHWSSALRLEMIRLYALEGARDVFEGAQREALTRLDRYEKERAERVPKGIR